MSSDSPPPDPRSPVSHRRTRHFHEQFAALPDEVRELALAKFQLFLRDPTNASFHAHTLKPTHRGSHLPASVSVRVNQQYRAIYVIDGNAYIWYWIGTHAEYNHFTGKN